MLTGDEERPGSPIAVARRDLIEAGRVADFALEFENLAREDGRDFGTVARRSSTSWTLRARGRTGHARGVFGAELGYGAIYEMARILDAFRRELPEPNLTYNVGVMAGGTPAAIDADGFRVTASGKTNIVAETAIARGDIRTLTPEQDARIRARDAGDRRPASAANRRRAGVRRGRLSADGADRGQSRAAGPRSTRSTATSACRKWPNTTRPGAAPPISSFVAARRRHAGGPRRGGRRRPCRGRIGRARQPARQAKRAAILITRLTRERPLTQGLPLVYYSYKSPEGRFRGPAMPKPIPLCAAVLLALSPTAAACQPAPPRPPRTPENNRRFAADYDAFLTAMAARFPDLPSLTVVVTRSDGADLRPRLRPRRPRPGRAATPDTVYYIASSTKSFLALAFARARRARRDRSGLDAGRARPRRHASRPSSGRTG